MTGTELAHYRFGAKLGEGGMGEVYRATDTKLDREVAVKLLPPAFTGDPERLARFEREAKLLAQLHHPHIASIFGIEEADGVRGLVMELVEGPTLAEKLAEGPLSPDESLAIAKQIAEALEAAHEKGIVHRDLKPQNIKLTRDGTVKVLDFGLAKAMDESAGAASGGDLARSPTLMNSPTLTAAHGTQLGVILGTAAYMAPEQARGVGVDKRADIWAFGVVLYEMLSGRRLFEGELVTDVLASVLRSEVDFSALPESTPAAIRRLLRRCLERRPKNRLHDIADARLVIDDAIAGVREEDAVAAVEVAPRSRFAGWLPWTIALLALGAAAAGWWPGRHVAASGKSASYELALAPPPDTELAIQSNAGWGVVSPDGRQVVFPATAGGHRSLWIRSLDRDDARPLPGTEAGFYPFWSPDSRSVAFFVTGSLMKLEIAGGLPERICVSQWGRGGSWNASGWIVFAPEGGGALARVQASGGEPIPLTELDRAAGEDAHYWPTWLPDGKSFVYFIRSGRRENQGIYLGRVLEGGVDRERRRIVATSSSGLFVAAHESAPATLLWVQEGRLLARAVDPSTGNLSGPVSEIARGVRVLESQRATMASVSAQGTLVFASAAVGQFGIEAYDRQGRALGPLPVERGDLHQMNVSPDGSRLAYTVVRNGQGDIWLLDLESGSSRALTSSATYDEQPIWSPDSQEVQFRSASGTDAFIAGRTRADGETAPQPIAFEYDDPTAKIRTIGAWMSEGWGLAAVTNDRGTNSLAAVDVRGNRRSQPLAAVGEVAGYRYSSAAKALAYLNDATGSMEGFVVSLEVTAGGVHVAADAQRIPVQGTQLVVWRQDGRELFAAGGDGAIWSVPVERREGALRLGTPRRLFEMSVENGSFAVIDNGERLLFFVDPLAAHQTLGVVTNWPARTESPSR